MCEFCKNIVCSNEEFMQARIKGGDFINKENDKYGILADTGDSGCLGYINDIHYCPMCGEKLKEDNEVNKSEKKYVNELREEINCLKKENDKLMEKCNEHEKVTNCDTVSKHKEICDKLNEIYEQKNRAYGNSFGETYAALGIISAVTRISDKFNRLKTLAKNKDIPHGDESISDTLLDMANYCIMTYMEVSKND